MSRPIRLNEWGIPDRLDSLGVGTMTWFRNEIEYIGVVDVAQRQGIATAMLAMARDKDPELKHGRPHQRTPDGELWVRSVDPASKGPDRPELGPEYQVAVFEEQAVVEPAPDEKVVAIEKVVVVVEKPEDVSLVNAVDHAGRTKWWAIAKAMNRWTIATAIALAVGYFGVILVGKVIQAIDGERADPRVLLYSASTIGGLLIGIGSVLRAAVHSEPKGPATSIDGVGKVTSVLGWSTALAAVATFTFGSNPDMGWVREASTAVVAVSAMLLVAAAWLRVIYAASWVPESPDTSKAN